MKKLFISSLGVASMLTLLLLALYIIPEKAGWVKHPEVKSDKCQHDCKGKDKHCGDGHKQHCDGGKSNHCGGKSSCDGHQSGCGGNEMRCEKEWKDADGKMHKEIRIEIRKEDGNNSCKGKGEMRGGCGMGESEMPMGGCCCCMMEMMMKSHMQMHGGMMNHCEMNKDSMIIDTSVRIKVRGKI